MNLAAPNTKALRQFFIPQNFCLSAYISAQAWNPFGFRTDYHGPDFTISTPPPPCNAGQPVLGYFWGGSWTYEVGKFSGNVDFYYNAGSAGDIFRVVNTATGSVLFDSGCTITGGDGIHQNVHFSGTSRLTVQDFGPCDGSGGNGFEFTLGCAY